MFFKRVLQFNVINYQISFGEMKNKIIFFEYCDIFFYYGLQSYNDFEFVISIVDFFYKSNLNNIYPSHRNLRKLERIMTLYGKRNHLKSQRVFKKVDKSVEKLEHYGQILEAYNFLESEKFLKTIKNSDPFAESIYDITQDLSNINYIEPNISKNSARVFIFLLTKSYFFSELYKKHWIEASESNKEIVVIIKNDKDFCINQSYFQNHKVFKLTTPLQILLNFQEYLTSINEVDIKFLDFISCIQNSSVVSMIII